MVTATGITTIIIIKDIIILTANMAIILPMTLHKEVGIHTRSPSFIRLLAPRSTSHRLGTFPSHRHHCKASTSEMPNGAASCEVCVCVCIVD